MATYVIGAACVDTMEMACVEVCPVNCIHHEEGVDRKLFIDPDGCIDCGACEPACPVKAIYREDDLPSNEELFQEIDELWYRDREKARRKLDEMAPRRGAHRAERWPLA